MSNNNNRSNTPRNTNSASQNQNRGPKSIWVVRPSFTTGDCRAYFNKDEAIKDFGQPSEEWVQTEDDVLEINTSPEWDNEFDIAWRLEKVDILSFSRETPSAPAPAKVSAPVTPAESTPEKASSTASS
ncbi:hypothetical protein PP914_gp129 [Arthrobacter phage Qui]|jgi:hypothetical protein|uniref:Uncharacterized protein n=1 Tax=Arthrobacter phage Qui TaxID=2603260 RepID=A0A5B8WPK9_9CAUD|nr:hypothetical protein PP914_gp129 [Arthrobacter phage Qui]QED11618.1 hypothetical protein SEA_QUI_129 [Arthrobacter phage Qui]QOC56450.1 hypothetical protein SEA_PAELLA_129 [Arthrobacter phage Paella]